MRPGPKIRALSLDTRSRLHDDAGLSRRRRQRTPISPGSTNSPTDEAVRRVHRSLAGRFCLRGRGPPSSLS